MLNLYNVSSGVKGKGNQWLLQLFWGFILIAGYLCDGWAQDAGSNAKPSDTELSLYDSITFDIKLSSVLALNRPVVTVIVVAPFTVNNIPERIDKWLDAVRKHGGSVELKRDPDYPASRDFGLVLDLISKAYDLAKETLIYSHAKHYNVDVLYKPGSGEVTRFVFALKEDAKN